MLGVSKNIFIEFSHMYSFNKNVLCIDFYSNLMVDNNNNNHFLQKGMDVARKRIRLTIQNEKHKINYERCAVKVDVSA